MAGNANAERHESEETAQFQPVQGCEELIKSNIATFPKEYDSEDEGVRTTKQELSEDELLKLVQPANQTMLGHLHTGALDKFKEEFNNALNEGKGFSAAAHDCTKRCMSLFDKEAEGFHNEQANWDSSKLREKLSRDIDAYTESVQTAKLSELTSTYEAKLDEALSAPVEALLDRASSDTWPAIRKLHKLEIEKSVSGFSAALSGFEMDKSTKDKMVSKLETHAIEIVEAKAKEAARKVLDRMKDRFTMLVTCDADSVPRVWTGKEDIGGIIKTARAASLKLLSVMAAIRLEDDADNIESHLSLALMDPKAAASTNKSITADPLASSSWDKIPPTRTLLTPVQCKSLWWQFKSEIQHTVYQAIAAQKASKRNNNWLLPPWAIFALLILGFIKFMTLLRNPLYLGLIYMVFLLAKALWVQLDAFNDFRPGFDDKMGSKLETDAGGNVEAKAKEEAGIVLNLLKHKAATSTTMASSCWDKVIGSKVSSLFSHLQLTKLLSASTKFVCRIIKGVTGNSKAVFVLSLLVINPQIVSSVGTYNSSVVASPLAPQTLNNTTHSNLTESKREWGLPAKKSPPSCLPNC